MIDVKETGEKMFVMKWRNFVVMLASLIIGTNTFTGLIFNQDKNTEDIEESEGATRRRIKNAIKELEYKIEIKDLKRELEQCKNK